MLKRTLLYCDEEHSIPWQNAFRYLRNDVHVYYFDTSLIKLDTSPFTTDEEKEKADRFLNENDKLNFLYGRYFTKMLLGKYHNSPSEGIMIEPGVNKKPYAKICNSNERLETEFNLSHSGKGLLIAFSQAPVGCDIEAIMNTNYKQMLPDIFTDEEAAFVNKSSSPLENFFKTWAAKEAVLKCNGSGLIDDLKQIEVCNSVNLVNAKQLQSSQNFFLTHFKVDNKFMAAVCQEGQEKKKISLFDGVEILKDLC